jgi:hypothetical protein
MLYFKHWKKISANIDCSAKLSFLTEGEIKSFYEKQKLKQFQITKPALQKKLKGIPHTE